MCTCGFQHVKEVGDVHSIVPPPPSHRLAFWRYLSFPPLKFEDIPGGTLGSWETLPQAGWAQIVALVAILDNSVFAQEPGNEPGDVVRDADGNDRIPWVRWGRAWHCTALRTVLVWCKSIPAALALWH